MTVSMRPVAAAMVLAKGAAMSGVLAALDVPFLQQVVIAGVSAILTGVFVIAAAIIAAKATHKTRTEVKEVKRGLGLDKREADRE